MKASMEEEEEERKPDTREEEQAARIAAGSSSSTGTTMVVPRPYQLELYEAALERNVIAYIPTGGGKTFIAILLLTEIARRTQRLPKEELQAWPATAKERQHKLMFFLVNTVPLVGQQANAIRQFTPLSVGEYFGDSARDTWSRKAWMHEFDAHDVFVMTPAIFLHILSRGFIRMREISLIIFDECHHARKDHPYNQIMRDFYYASDVAGLPETTSPDEPVGIQRPGRPKIFGMTASPVHIAIRQIHHASSGAIGAVLCAEELRKLERRMDCLVYTPLDTSQVWQHIVRPKESLLLYASAPALPSHVGWNSLIQEYQEVVRQKYGSKRLWKERHKRGRPVTPAEIVILDECKSAQAMLEEMGPLCTYRAVQEKLQEMAHTADPNKRGLSERVSDSIQNEILGHLQYILNEGRVPKLTPKVAKLMAKLAEYRDKPEFRAIVFVEKRSTAKALAGLVQLFCNQEQFCFLSCDYLVGHGTKSMASHKLGRDMNYKDQTQVIKRFRTGEINLLIATSVAEEGLDIQPCNLVIRYSSVRSSTQYIQSRGRARHSEAEYFVMVAENDVLQHATISNAHATEALMEAACSSRSLDTDADEDVNEFASSEELLQVVKTGAKITLCMAIQLVYLYAAKLPGDKYTSRIPEFNLTTSNSGGNIQYQYRLRLPCDAAFTELHGPLCSSRKEAKQRAALEACRKLRECGALDDCLLPTCKSALPPSYSDSSEEESESYDQKSENLCIDQLAAVGQVSEEPILECTSPVPRVLVGQWPIDTTLPLRVQLYSIRTHDIIFRYGFITSATAACCACPIFSIYPRDPLRSVFRKRALASGTKLSRVATIDEPTEFETQVVYEKGQALVLTPDQVVLAWKFHYILSTVVLATRPSIANLLATSRVVLCDSTSSANHLQEGKMYLVLPLTMASTTKLGSKDNGKCKDNAHVTHHSVVIDWTLIDQVVQLAEDGITLNQAPAHDSTTGEHQPANKLDVACPSSYEPIPLGDSSFSTATAMDEGGSTLSSYPLTRMNGIANMNEPLVLYQRHAPENFYVFFRLRSDLSPASRLLGTRKRHISQTDNRPTVLSNGDVEEGTRTFVSHYREKYGIELREDQPLCEAIYLPHSKNLLKPDLSVSKTEEELRHTTLFVIPELCRVHPIHGALLADALLLPSIMWKVESLFLVDEFVRLSGLPITKPQDWKWITEALTAPSCDEGINYQALETLGDSFLKVAVSTHLFLNNPHALEGRLTHMRTEAVCNRTLTQIALNKDIVRYIATVPYALARFHMPGVGISSPDTVREVSQNTLADCIEAIIGASYIIGDLSVALHMMRWLGFDLSGCSQLNYWRGYNEASPQSRIPPTQSDRTACDPHFFRGLESKLGYDFLNKALLYEACTHPSSPHVPRSYQRLEFLGDAVLDFLVIRHVYQSFISADQAVSPVLLSNMRSEVSGNDFLAAIVVQNGFHRYLMHCSQPLHQSIARFIESFDFPASSDSQPFRQQVAAPKALGDLFESLVGAVFIDSGGNLARTWDIFAPLLTPHFGRHSTSAMSAQGE